MTEEPRVFGDRDRRLFGLVGGGILLVLSARSRWRGGAAWPWLLAPGLALAVVGAAAPARLEPVFKVWMRFALVMGAVNTAIITGLVYALIFIPTGLLRRLRKADPLDLKSRRASYWVARGAPRAREDYARQF